MRVFAALLLLRLAHTCSRSPRLGRAKTFLSVPQRALLLTLHDVLSYRRERFSFIPFILIHAHYRSLSIRELLSLNQQRVAYDQQRVNS